MRTLFEIQKKFSESIVHHHTEIHEMIDSHPSISAAEKIAIYQDSVLNAMQRALEKIYPVCQKLVGNDFFTYLINRYIKNHPSITPDLNEYGSLFPKFLEENSEIIRLSYLVDIAFLEWNWHGLYKKTTKKKFNFNKLRSYESQAEDIIFKLSTNITLLTSSYPIHHIFLTNQTDTSDGFSIILKPNQQFFFIMWREGFTKKMDALTEMEWFLLNCFKNKLSLGEISQSVINLNYEVNISLMIPKMIQRGWLADFTVNIL